MVCGVNLPKCPASHESGPVPSDMRKRITLLLLLLAATLALFLLVPRSPLVLGWLWNSASDLAAEQGYRLSADRLSGNALTGITIFGLSVSGPGINLSSEHTQLDYGLASLLRGRLDLAMDLAAVRGDVDPAALQFGGDGAGFSVPVDLTRLSIDDFQLTVDEYDLYLPAVSLDELAVSTSDSGVLIRGSLQTPDGTAGFDGSWQPEAGLLALDILDADVRIARHWWDGAEGGHVTGELRASAEGVEFDAFVHEGSIDYIEVQVADISGPVSMRNLVIEGQLQGTGLAGPVEASVTVDIPAESYRGLLTGDPRLEEAVPWLGRTLDIDLTGIPAEGPMDLVALVTGWEQTLVTGQAGGTGSLAGLDLGLLQGSFDYRTETGISVTATGFLADGPFRVQLAPEAAGLSGLLVQLTDVQLLTGEPGLRLSAEGAVSFDILGGEPAASTASLSLQGEVLDQRVDLNLSGTSADTFNWQVLAGGSLGSGELTGQATLDFSGSTVLGQLGASGLSLPGVPWPAQVDIVMQEAALALPLEVSASASSGPLALPATTYRLDFHDGVALVAADGSLVLSHRGGETTLKLDSPALTLAALGGEPEQVEVSGQLHFADGVLQPDLSASYRDLNLQLEELTDGVLRGSLRGTEHELAASFNTADQAWELEGELPVTAVAALFGLEAGGRLAGTARGRAAEVLAADIAGTLQLEGQELDLVLTAPNGELLVQGTSTLLGLDWELTGSIWPQQELTATSPAGSLQLTGRNVAGAGDYPLPQGVQMMRAGQWFSSVPWQLAGDLDSGVLQLASGNSQASLSLFSGSGITASVTEDVRVLGTSLQVSGQLAETGAMTGEVRQGSLSVTLQGNLADRQLGAAGSLPAAAVQEMLVGEVDLDALLSWQDGLAVSGNANWQGLTGEFAWQAGAPADLQLRAEGLTGSLQDGSLKLELQDFALDPHVELPIRGLAVSGTATGTLGSTLQQLQLDFAAGTDWLDVQASGFLEADQLDLAVSATLAGDLVTLDGRLTGPTMAPGFTGRLMTGTLELPGVAELPAQELALSFTADSGLDLQGDRVQLQVDRTGWHGTAVLEFLLLGQAHSLELQPAGEPVYGTGVLSGYLSGPAANGELSLGDGITFDLSLQPPAGSLQWLESLVLSGTSDLAGNWNARLQASAASPLAALEPLTLGAELEGDLTQLQGIGNLRAGASADRLLTVTASSDWSDLQLAADLASLDSGSLAALFGLSADLGATGEALLSLAPGATPMLTAQGRVSGQLAGTALELLLTADTESLSLAGTYAAEPVALDLTFLGVPQLTAAWGTASLELTAEADGQGQRYSGRLFAQEDSPLGVAAEVDLAVRTQEGRALLEEASGAVGPVQLSLAGELSPVTALTGSVLAPWSAEALPVTVSSEDGLLARASSMGLELTAAWRAGALQLGLQGRPDGQPLEVALGWSPASGFSGNASGQLHLATDMLEPLQLDVQAQENGNLQLAVQAALSGVPGNRPPQLAVQAVLAARPWLADALGGSVSASLNLADLLPALGARSLTFSFSGRLGGSVLEPRVSGSVIALGALEASGRFTAGLSGASLNLTGEGIDVSAEASLEDWQASLAVAGLELQALESLLPGSRLQFEASGHGPWDLNRATVTLHSLAVTDVASTVTGRAELQDGVVAADLQLDVLLPELAMGASVSGSAAGSLQLDGMLLHDSGSGRLAGDITLTEIGLAGTGNLSGAATLIGTPRAPHVTAQLSGPGSGSGQEALELDWQPASERFQLASRLALGAVATDLQLLSSPTTGQIASGIISLPGGWFELGSSTTGSFVLTGNEDFAGWQLQVSPGDSSANLRGDFSSLGTGLAGQLDFTARLGPSGPEFAGGITGLSALGTMFGDVTLSTSRSGGTALVFAGDGLQGRVSLGGDWQLDRLELAVNPEVSVVLSADGDLTGGNVNASVAGRLLGEPLLGTVTAELAAGVLQLGAALDLLGGTADVAATLTEGAWQGSVDLAGLEYGGVTLEGSGGIFGDLLSPYLELQTGATVMGLAGHGTLRLGPELLEFHQTLSGGGLGGDVVLQGNLYPQPSLLLTGPDGHSFRLEQAGADSQLPLLERALVSSGNVSLTGSAATVNLTASPEGEAADLEVELLLLPGLAVNGRMQLSSLRGFLEQLDEGIQLAGALETYGSLRLDLLAGSLQLDAFGLNTPAGSVDLTGSVSLAGDSRLSGHYSPAPGFPGDFPGLAGTGNVPFAVLSSGGIIRFVSSSSLGDIDADYSLASGQASLSAHLRSAGGTANLQLAWSDKSGFSGSILSSGLVLFELPGGPPGTLDADVNLVGGRITGTAWLQLGTGQLSVAGNWGLADLLPDSLATRQERGGNLELRVGSFELSELPLVARYAPALSGGVTAVVQLRDDVIAGNLVASGLRAAGSPLPIEAIISGSPSRIEVGASLTGSPLSLTLENGVLSGLLEMRRFPLQTLAEAAAGPLDVTAEVTGVARFSLPLGELEDSEVRIATEQVHFERSGVVTSGNLSLELRSGVLEVSEVSFAGAGSWEAGGVLRADELDFRLEAVDADFGPMLGLIPALNQLGVAAAGTVSLQASGTLADPQISVVSQTLDFTVAGVSYRLEDVELALRSTQLSVAAELLATDPIQGSLSLSGSGGVMLSPLSFQDARFEFAGSLVLPFIGQLEGIRGAIQSADSTPGAPLLAEVEAQLGNPLRVSGSLTPLDLAITGEGLQVDLPSIFLRETRLDANLSLIHDEGFELGGEINVLESLLSLNRGSGAGISMSGGIAESFRFDSLLINAPARLRLAESFGTAELAGGLTVTGNLADPRLDGRAEALRGTFQFAGRDFELQEAVAQFDANRGLYPELRVTATTTLDRSRLLSAGSSLQVVSPSDGQAVVTLSFTGTIEPDPERGFQLNLDPVLSSNVIVQPLRDDGLASASRPLSEDELLALITLGRTEFASLGGEAGLAPSVAQGALETAVDMLILSELQRALGQALGLELVEIRSSALSNLLTGNGADQQFGISLRLGGYVSDEVFATYRVSAFDDPEGLYAFSNEIGIRYALGPVILNLAGSLNLPEAQELSAVAQLSLAVLYEFNPTTTLEAAFDLSSEEQQFRFGVTWRW